MSVKLHVFHSLPLEVVKKAACARALVDAAKSIDELRVSNLEDDMEILFVKKSRKAIRLRQISMRVTSPLPLSVCAYTELESSFASAVLNALSGIIKTVHCELWVV